MAHLLGLEKVTVEYPTRTVLRELTLGVFEGDRIGIVGRNGEGKSTLAKLLSRQKEPDSGRATFRNGLNIGVLTQMDTLEDEARVQEIITPGRAEHEWAADANIREITRALLGNIDPHTKVKTLSGGQRRRLDLAALLMENWDVLVLDEPTNHLDMEAIHWLAKHLRTRWVKGRGALLCISHDRWFLDEVCERMWEVHDERVDAYEGGYAAYVLQRVERERIAQAREQKRQQLLKKELAWLRRGAPARTSKPKFRIEAANALIERVPQIRNRIQLEQLAIARLGKDVITLEDVSHSFGKRELFCDINWILAPGERSGILGANGSGKSTLISIMTKAITPTEGRVKHGKTVKIAVLDQSFSQLREIENDRVREVLGRYRTTFFIDKKELNCAQMLERLGFLREHLSARVGELSGGQKRRLQILMVLLEEPNVLILDEPTNDVDTEMLTALEDLLDSWSGCLIVISHDRYFLERVTDQQYGFVGGRFRHLPGGIEEYMRLSSRAATGEAGFFSGERKRETSTRGIGAREKENGEKAGTASGMERSAAAPTPAVTHMTGAKRRALEKEAQSLERKLEKLQQQLADCDSELAAADPSDYEALLQLDARRRALAAECNTCETRWYTICEELGL